MDWQNLLNQLNAEYKDLGVDNPPIEIYAADTGKQLKIVDVYHEVGIICIDVRPI